MVCRGSEDATMASPEDEQTGETGETGDDGAASIRITDHRRFTETGEDRSAAAGAAGAGDEGGRSAQARSASSGERGRDARETDAADVADAADEGGVGRAAAAEAEEAAARVPFDLDRLGIEAIFVVFFQSAMLRLGAVDPSTGEALPVDLDEARQSIELLRLLDEKTRGNLTEEEGRTLRRLIHDAQVQYVAVARRQQESSGGKG